MNHIAIMSKQFGDLIPRILRGEKRVESRWSKHQIAPWNKIHPGDVVYFKNSGGPVIAKAAVSKVLQFDSLSSEKIKEILDKWGGKDGIGVTSCRRTLEWAGHKKYCVLIWLKNPEKTKPFKIDKTGFGTAVAWLCVGNINRIRLQ